MEKNNKQTNVCIPQNVFILYMRCIYKFEKYLSIHLKRLLECDLFFNQKNCIHYDIPVTVHYDDATRGTTIYYVYVYTI